MPMFPTPPLFPMGPMPAMPMFPNPMPMAIGGMPEGVMPSVEVQQEADRAYLTMQRQQLLQGLQALDEYRKLLNEQVATIDKQLEKLADAARERQANADRSQATT